METFSILAGGVMTLMFIPYILLCGAVGYAASENHRYGTLWMAGAVFVTPIFAILLLIACGKAQNQKAAEAETRYQWKIAMAKDKEKNCY